MLSDAMRAPTRTTDRGLTLFVGGVLLALAAVFPVAWLFALAVSPLYLVLAPLAVFPPLLVLGYDLRVIAAGASGTATVPPFVRWNRLLADGLRSLVVSVAYLLPPAITLGLAAGGATVLTSGELAIGAGRAEAVAGLLVALALAFALFYGVLYLYLRPAALAAYAVTGRLRTAFAPTRVLGIALRGDFAVAWLLAGVVLLIGLSVAVPLTLLLAGFFLAFYVRTVAYYLYGDGAAAALAAARIADAPAENAPVSIVGAGPGRDGSRRHRWVTDAAEIAPGAEPPAAVQVGRDVPASAPRAVDGGAAGNAEIGDDRDSDRDSETDDESEPSDAGFEWNNVSE